MNKRAYFILFPLLAILFSIGWDNNAVFFQKPAGGLIITPSLSQADFTFYTGVKRENKSHAKNAMRVKARYDVIAINITPLPDLFSPLLCTQEVVFSGYRNVELSTHFSTNGLRGPPTA